MSTPSDNNPDFVFFPEWSTLRVVGPDAASWLNGLVTCDVLSVRPGTGAWGTLLTKQGKIAAELQIVGHKEELFVAVSGGDAALTLQVLDGYLVMEDAEIARSDAEWVVFGESSRGAILEVGMSPSTLPWTFATILVACGTAEQRAAFASVAADRTLDPTEWHRWMLEQGLPRFGADYDERDNLHAASLERRTVDWQKGCYLGQEVVCMQDMRGKVKKRLVRLCTDAGTLEAGAEVTTTSGEVVGRVTSAAGAIAIASVFAPHFETGTVLRVGSFSVYTESLRA